MIMLTEESPLTSAPAAFPSDVCAPSLVRRIATLLDIDAAPILEAGVLPRGWHFPLLAGETRRTDMRKDGFPGFGVPMPDLGLPRLLLLGRTVEFRGDLQIGSSVVRSSAIEKMQRRGAADAPSAIVTVNHSLAGNASTEPAIVERQSYILLPASPQADRAGPRKAPVASSCSKVVTPDEIMLFQYSALGFNSHKIHLDRAYARDVEGLPDLVVNGGLITLLMTEFLRTAFGARPSRIRTRHLAPLYCGRPVTLSATRDAASCRLEASDDVGWLAAEMEADLQ